MDRNVAKAFALLGANTTLIPSDYEAITRAIAGEGRLYLIPPLYLVKYGDSGELISCEIVKEQDQGVQKEMMEKSLQDQGGE